jgi:hypothetical protein
MATGTAGTNARELPFQAVHYLRKTVTYASENTQIKVGTVPAGSVILYPLTGLHVVTAFNDTGTDTYDLGTLESATLFASAVAISAGFQAIDENVAGLRVSSDTDIYFRYNGENNNADAGEGEMLVAFIPDNDG